MNGLGNVNRNKRSRGWIRGGSAVKGSLGSFLGGRPANFAGEIQVQAKRQSWMLGLVQGLVLGVPRSAVGYISELPRSDFFALGWGKTIIQTKPTIPSLSYGKERTLEVGRMLNAEKLETFAESGIINWDKYGDLSSFSPREQKDRSRAKAVSWAEYFLSGELKFVATQHANLKGRKEKTMYVHELATTRK